MSVAMIAAGSDGYGCGRSLVLVLVLVLFLSSPFLSSPFWSFSALSCAFSVCVRLIPAML